MREQAGRKERGGGEWLALERGEGGWEMERAVAHGKKKKKKESLGKKGRQRDREEEHERQTRSGGGG